MCQSKDSFIRPADSSTGNPAHTPGPWAVYANARHSIDCLLMVEADNGERIAYVADFGKQSESPDRHHANARLIAAAPALLAYAECEEAHRNSLLPSTKGGSGNGFSYMEVFSKHGFDGRDVYGFLDKMRRSAIAAAKTGGTQ